MVGVFEFGIGWVGWNWMGGVFPIAYNELAIVAWDC